MIQQELWHLIHQYFQDMSELVLRTGQGLLLSGWNLLGVLKQNNSIVNIYNYIYVF
jgi:hypothetical protein